MQAWKSCHQNGKKDAVKTIIVKTITQRKTKKGVFFNTSLSFSKVTSLLGCLQKHFSKNENSDALNLHMKSPKCPPIFETKMKTWYKSVNKLTGL